MQPQTHSGGAKTVLIVDDEYNIVEALKLILTSEGFDVVTASDGEEALERLGTLRPDVILLDVMMPRLDGREVLARLRRGDGEKIPVILTTGAPDLIKPTLLDDHTLLFVKPIAIDLLLNTIRTFVGQ